MGMMGWFMLVTIPIGGLVFILYLLVLIIYMVWKKRRGQTSAQAGAVSG